MATYSFVCPKCAERHEVDMPMKDILTAPAPACPVCGSPMKQVIGAAGIHWRTTGSTQGLS